MVSCIPQSGHLLSLYYGMSLFPLLDEKLCLVSSLNLATYCIITVLYGMSLFPLLDEKWCLVQYHPSFWSPIITVHSRPQYSTSVPSVPLSSQVNRTVRFALIQNNNNKNYFKKLFYIRLILKLDCKPDFYNFYFIYLIFKLQYNSA